MSCSRTQRSDAGEAQTRDPSISRQAHCSPRKQFISKSKVKQALMAFDFGIISLKRSKDTFATLCCYMNYNRQKRERERERERKRDRSSPFDILCL